MNNVNQKIIDAVIAKAEKICPDSLALIGVYGSVATGDEYEKSDLDLLILIQNDDGWKLGTGFILENSGVGYDIYCTDWDGLRFDAECHHARLSKLLDSKIVYIKNQDAYDELCKLREQATDFLNSEERSRRVNELIEKAKISYANSCLHDTIGQVRSDAYYTMLFISNALMLHHGVYFKHGVKKTFEELSKLPVDEEFSDNMRKTAAGKDVSELRALLKNLVLYAENHVKRETKKEEPSERISGTYEEMYSNWRNKVEEAAVNNDVFSSFMNMCGLDCMLSEISSEVNIGSLNIMEDYDPDCLEANIRTFDEYLEKYERICEKAGVTVKRFSDIDEFVADYFKN